MPGWTRCAPAWQDRAPATRAMRRSLRRAGPTMWSTWEGRTGRRRWSRPLPPNRAGSPPASSSGPAEIGDTQRRESDFTDPGPVAMALESRTFRYDTELTWRGGRSCEVTAGHRPPVLVVPPAEFPGGEDADWSPEHLFLASLQSCTMLSFLAHCAH